MTTNKIGGNKSDDVHFRLYLFGLIIGTLIRAIAFLAPIGVVHRLEELLLPDDVVASDSNESH